MENEYFRKNIEIPELDFDSLENAQTPVQQDKSQDMVTPEYQSSQIEF
jgi:hypothetical protein